MHSYLLGSPFFFQALRLRKSIEKCTSDWHSIYIAGLAEYLCEWCKHKYSISLFRRQSIFENAIVSIASVYLSLSLPLSPSSPIWWALLFLSVCPFWMCFGYHLSMNIISLNWKICHAPATFIRNKCITIFGYRSNIYEESSEQTIMKNALKSILLT